MAKVKNEHKKTVACGMSAEEKEELRVAADAQYMSMSGYTRKAVREKLDGGCNEPAVMLSLVDLTQKISGLKGKIPDEDYESLQENIANIMILKLGIEKLF